MAVRKKLQQHGSGWALGHGLFGRRQRPAQRGRVACPLPLELASRSGHLLGHGYIGFIHRSNSGDRDLARARERKKKTDVVEHPEVFDHVGLLFNEPPGTAGLPFI